MEELIEKYAEEILHVVTGYAWDWSDTDEAKDEIKENLRKFIAEIKS